MEDASQEGEGDLTGGEDTNTHDPSFAPEPEGPDFSQGEESPRDTQEEAPPEGTLGTHPGEGQPRGGEQNLGNASIWVRNWARDYEICPRWGNTWKDFQSGGWQTGFQVFKDRMFFEDRLCVPLSLQNWVVKDCHEFLGHVGSDKLWAHIEYRYSWANKSEAKKFVTRVGQICNACQACQRPRALGGALRHTPIPPAPMVSVAIDLFRLPLVRWEGVEYDMLAVCIDRHSGWIVAVPCRNKGLTGAKVAKAMLKFQWRPFGIPSKISSDQGSHFTGAWWHTMCATLGIRHAFSQAYHHRANGRVERAGQEILERLRKLSTNHQVNWVEVLPQVIDRYHDTPGESGYSPYEILFGRPRPLADRPYTPPTVCEDAVNFFCPDERFGS